jgi:hypothetical protein
MKGIELLEKYPEAAKVITEFYNNKLKDSMDTEEITEEFKEMIKSQEFDNQYVATFIDSNPRFLFDVFDSNGIFISIKYGLDGFTWSNMQSDASELKDTTIYLFRKEAEAVAVEKAFEILNEKLCQTK